MKRPLVSYCGPLTPSDKNCVLVFQGSRFRGVVARISSSAFDRLIPKGAEVAKVFALGYGKF